MNTQFVNKFREFLFRLNGQCMWMWMKGLNGTGLSDPIVRSIQDYASAVWFSGYVVFFIFRHLL